MEEVFTIMRRFVQTLSKYYGYALTDNRQLMPYSDFLVFCDRKPGTNPADVEKPRG